jgi:hypothetical protein
VKSTTVFSQDLQYRPSPEGDIWSQDWAQGDGIEICMGKMDLVEQI